MKKGLILTLIVMFFAGGSCLAGPFSDVPAGHYGYDVLKRANELGLVSIDISKPLTRYEMATAVAEIMEKQDMLLAQAEKEKKKKIKKVIKKKPPKKPAVAPPVVPPVVPPVELEKEKVEKKPPVERIIDPRKYVTKGELQETLADYATKDDVKKVVSDAVANLATKKDVADAVKDAVKGVDIVGAVKDKVDRKDLDEFRKLVTKLGKDLKDELSAIGVRISDIEKEQAELKDKVADLEKRIPNITGEIRLRGTRELQDKENKGEKPKDTTFEQRTRVRLTKSIGEDAEAVVQYRRMGAFVGGTPVEGLEISTVSANAMGMKFTAGLQYFSLGAYGLLVHDNDAPKGALVVEKSLGRTKLSAVYAQIVSGGGLREGKLTAGRLELPLGAGTLGATVRLKGADTKLDDFKQGIAGDIKVGPISAEYAMYKENVANAKNNKALVAGVELGKNITVSVAQIDKTYALAQCVTKVKQDDLPLIIRSESDKKDKTTAFSGTLKLGALDVEVVKVVVDKKATIEEHKAEDGLGARVTLTRNLAENVELQLRGTMLGKGDNQLIKGRGQLLIKF